MLNKIIMISIVILMLLIGQGCTNSKINNGEKQLAVTDSLIEQGQMDTASHIVNETKLSSDTINGVWYIFQRFSDVSYSDTIFNSTTHLIIENNLITKLTNNKVVFFDSITNTESTKNFKKYQLSKREKDFFKYSKKHNTIRLFIGGEDGIREIYKRNDKL